MRHHRDHAEEKLRFFIRVDPKTREQDILYQRDDLEWNDKRDVAVDAEVKELVAKDAHEKQMDAGEVTQIIKVADDMVMFTGFIEDDVVVSFERGILILSAVTILSRSVRLQGVRALYITVYHNHLYGITADSMSSLPPIVDGFREYMLANEIDFTALEA